MFNIFTAKKGKHEAKHFSSKHQRALIIAAVLASVLLTGVSAAIIIPRDTPGAIASVTKDEVLPSPSGVITAGKQMAQLWQKKALQNALKEEKDSRISEVKEKKPHERLSRALKAIAMSRAVRDELYEHSTVAYSNQAVTVFLPKGQFPGETRYEEGVALADAIAFARFAGTCDISRDADTIYMKGSEHDVSIRLGTEYITSSGRVFWAKRTLEEDGERIFVPLDALARAFGFEQAEDNGDYLVRLTGNGTVTSGEDFYREDEVYWLSRIIQAESRGECLTGKIAVGNVVLNRVRDTRFPNTIYGVIFDRSCGVQFTPTANGTIYREPSEESVNAAKICLEGYSISDEITFFFNPAISQSTWISDNRPWVCTIGNHAFYS